MRKFSTVSVIVVTIVLAACGQNSKQSSESNVQSISDSSKKTVLSCKDEEKNLSFEITDDMRASLTGQYQAKFACAQVDDRGGFHPADGMFKIYHCQEIEPTRVGATFSVVVEAGGLWPHTEATLFSAPVVPHPVAHEIASMLCK